MICKVLTVVACILLLPPMSCFCSESEHDGDIGRMLADMHDDRSIMEYRIRLLRESEGISEAERDELENYALGLYNSLTSTTEQLTLAYSSILAYEGRVREYELSLLGRERMLVVLLGLTMGRVAMVFIGWVLYIKRVRIPKWMDMIL